MSTFETLQIIIRATTLLVVIVSAYLTIKQLRLNAVIFQDDHEWKRRNASNEIIQQINECEHNIRLNDIFQLSTNYTPLKLDLIEDKIQEDHTVQNSIHKVLNDYEGLAVGINQGLYDEEVIRYLREYAMTRVYANLEEYINKRRLTHTMDAWKNYHNLIKKWNAPKMESKFRQRTGRFRVK